MRYKVDTHVTMYKIRPHISPEYRKLWGIPEEHEAFGVIGADCEDVMWLALDDATKKARIKVVHCETVYGGRQYAWSKFGGEITAIISGEKVEDVRNGLRYTREYIENHSGIIMFNEEHTLGCYVDCIPRAGKFYQQRLPEIKEGDSFAYLVCTPVESTYALDKALKAGNTKLVELFHAPTRVNTGGGILVGTESACRAAVEAFVCACEYCANHPMDLDI